MEESWTLEELRDDLKDSHRVFSHEYIIDWNGTRSYKVAYPDVDDNTAAVNAHKLLRNTKIKQYISIIKENIEEECNITKISQIKVLQSIIQDVDASNRDRATAVQELNKMLGFNAPEKKDININSDLIEASKSFIDKYK